MKITGVDIGSVGGGPVESSRLFALYLATLSKVNMGDVWPYGSVST